MKSNTQYKVENNLAIILVGDPKAGKTRLMMSFPDPYIIDLDRNLSSAFRVAGDKTFFYNQMDLDDNDQPIPLIAPAGSKAKDQWETFLARIEAAAKDPKVKTICVDSLTRLGEFIESYIIARLKMMNVKLRADTVDEQIRLSDYDTYATFILRAVAVARASGKLVVFTSHQTAKDDPLTGTSKMRFSIAGKLKETIGGYFTDVLGLRAETKVVMEGGKPVEKTTYKIRTRPLASNQFVPLGTSIPTLDAEIDITDKNLKEIWALLEPKLSLSVSKI